MNKSLRKALYEDVITFPLTKTAGAITLAGTVVSAYEKNTFGTTRVLISATDGDAVTDDLMITSYGSWDEGSTFLAIDRNGTLTGASDGAVNTSVSLGNLIPRVRVDGIFDASGALTATHGSKVDVVIEEAEQEAIKEVSAEFTMAGDLSGVETEYTAAQSLAVPALLDYAGIAIIVEDSSDITVGTTIGWKVQTSMDGTRWNDLAVDVTDDLVVVDTNAPVYIEVEYVANLGKYVRVAITGTTSSVLLAANIKMYAVLS